VTDLDGNHTDPDTLAAQRPHAHNSASRRIGGITMRRILGIAVAVLLIAGAGVYAFHDQIWPDTKGPHRGAGGTAGDNLGKKRGGG
jgi:hypothetical protein